MTKRILALAVGLVLALSGAASAQISTGNIYGVAKDESGALLPGVNATITSEFGTRSTVSGSDGTFRFLSLNKGDYTITLSLAGFASTVRKFKITTGENVELDFSMKVSGVAETVEVQAETPLVDSKKRGTATTMTSEELSSIPNARDPWGVLRAVPGVMVDRVNIAGNENGQQATSSSKGQPSAENTWNLDGIVITDMSATGASPTYFDFGAFQEITVTTGGTDLSMATGGAGINLTTRRGTNAFHGSARYMVADEDMSFGNINDQDQSPFVPNQLAVDPRLRNADGSFRDQGDRISSIKDYGFDLGGPIFKDKLWFYGSYGKQDIKLLRLTNTKDDTLLPSYNAKLNWQATSNTMISAFYFLGSKQKFGRSPGSGLGSEADSFLWNQDNAYTDGGLPGGLWKLQVDHTFSPNLFVSLKGMYYDTGFTLAPRGDLGQSYTLDSIAGQAIGSFYTYLAVRPQKNLTGDGSYFFQGMGGSHELKFGFSYRDMKTHSATIYSGNQLTGHIDSATNIYSRVYRGTDLNYGGKYTNFYVGDMFTKDRFTFNIGVRYDMQNAKNLVSAAPENATFPDRLPAAEFPGNDENLQEWNTWSPRLGLSYALDESRRTIVRASFARYYEQLAFGNVTRENPTSVGYIQYGWNDANGDKFVQPGEVNFNDFRASSNVNLANPGSVSADTVNKLDRDRKPRSDNEFIVGLDRELGASFAAGLAFTYRKSDNWTTAQYRFSGACSDPLNPTKATCPLMQASDYTQNAPVTAQGYTAFSLSPNPALVSAGRSGRLTTNRDGFSTTYTGLELTLNKRLSNKWMARVAFTYGDWTKNQDLLVGENGNPTRIEEDNLVDGDQVALRSGGSGKGALYYTGQKWQFYANALYQLPWGIDLSGTAWGREGGLKPVFMNIAAGNDGTLRVAATPTVDSERYGDIWDFDLRLAKTFRFGKQAYFTLAGEWFNVANSGQTLIRIRQANTASYNRIDEVLNPSTFRLGATFGF
ncbi:MAG: carboxypeptidase regulatory-like domain-containing protein [Vicinamibacterales bacterium]